MVSTSSKASWYSRHGWLDFLAVSMSIVCAIHCLLTPVMIVLFPILATTIWVQHNFHLWMLLFVLPTTSIAVFLGCRKHNDKIILLLSIIGISLLAIIALYETLSHYTLLFGHHHHNCSHHGMKHSIINVIGGISLACAHIRNYWLCRSSRCSH